MAKPKKRYKKHPGLLLSELEKVTSPCTNCGADNSIDWLNEMRFPHEAIEPHGGGGRWVPISVPVQCKICESHYHHKIPVLERESTWHLYGDEAWRIIEDKGKRIHFFCITLVALHNSRQEELNLKLRKFKLEARPELAPEEWPHHFTEIWSDSGAKRKFALSGLKEKIQYGERLAKMIAGLSPEIVCYNISSATILKGTRKEIAATIKLQKEQIFKEALLITLDSMRQNKKGVVWHFDNVKDSTTREVTEGWAMECFLGLQYTPLFTYLAGGTYIPEPEFMKPGSHPLLEIADFISFCVARDFMKIFEGKLGEVPSARLGKINCYRTNVDGQPDAAYEMASFFLMRYFLP
ncbi:hypothetical protein ACF8GG_15920 [Pseudomonas sp. yb_1]|uniref:hypothetical protein n=1 Tax=Pseudomonas sp. yb_1 TaxID=3367217 RepID=UPI00370C43B4